MDSAQCQPLLDAIARALVPLPEVRAGLLFGSQASGRARPGSDVDVAVLLSHRAALGEPGACTRRLLGALHQELAADKLDLVVLNDAPSALAFQVLKHGVLAFERDRADLVAFRVRTYAAHADYAPVERFFREVTKHRILGGTRG